MLHSHQGMKVCIEPCAALEPRRRARQALKGPREQQRKTLCCARTKAESAAVDDRASRTAA